MLAVLLGNVYIFFGFGILMKQKINLFLRKLKKIPDFYRVKFVILFGSYASGRQNKLSDIDFAVYYDGDKDERYEFRKNILGILPEKFDVKIFQDLPLYVRKEVLKGKIVYARDLSFVYDVAYETIKLFNRFKKYYYDYLDILVISNHNKDVR